MEPRDSTLFRYLTQFCSSSVSDLLDWPADEPRLPLFVYPWWTFKKGEISSPKTALPSRFCGPSSMDFAVEEYWRTIRLYEAMKGTGYRPWHFSNTFIAGTLLLKPNDERRFIVLQGNHRFAILAHLSVAEIRVRDTAGYLAVIGKTEAHQWPLVANGTCTHESALRVFDLFFDYAGHHVLAQLAPPVSHQSAS